MQKIIQAPIRNSSLERCVKPAEIGDNDIGCRQNHVSVVIEQYDGLTKRLTELTDCIEKRFASVLRLEPTEAINDNLKVEENIVPLADSIRANNRAILSIIHNLENIIQRCELPG